MNLKFKVLGLGLLALVATSAFAAVNASATNGGHFVSEVSGTTIRGQETAPNHKLHFRPHAGSLTERIGCDVATYHGSAANATETEIEITPTYEKCYTTDENKTAVVVTHNKCKFRFGSVVGGTSGTVDVLCAEKAIEIHHPNCTITVPSAPNQNLSGIHYTRVTEQGKHAITMHVNVTFTTEYHGGICIFLGTHQFGRLEGSATVWGEKNGERKSITAT
jgi:hypothetical protein